MTFKCLKKKRKQTTISKNGNCFQLQRNSVSETVWRKRKIDIISFEKERKGLTIPRHMCHRGQCGHMYVQVTAGVIPPPPFVASYISVCSSVAMGSNHFIFGKLVVNGIVFNVELLPFHYIQWIFCNLKTNIRPIC